MKQTRIHLEWCGNPVRRFRTGVSLHSHTLHSHETLAFVYRLAERVACLRWVLRGGETQYRLRHERQLDLGRAWWTPPCAPYDAWRLETNQIHKQLQLNALVSLTDHDCIEAPLSLRTLESFSNIPVSAEWSVPYAGTFFHLGVHNLPADEARQVFDRLRDLTARPEDCDLAQVLECLSNNPETLIVFNHPCWDEKEIGVDRHLELARDFLCCYGRFIHALELNGFRSWKENREVLQMARAFGKPVVSGGDRHGFEASTIVDLSNAATFSEYAEQVRSGWSDLLITNQYRDSFKLRVLRALEEILQDYEMHGRGWRSWSDRVFYRCDDDVVRSVTELFPRGIPGAIQLFVNSVGLIRNAGVQRTFRLIMPQQQEFAL